MLLQKAVGPCPGATDGARPTDLIAEVRAGHARGWSFTPLRGKVPTMKGWQSRPREDLDTALAWAVRGNVGLRTGAASRVLVIDVDHEILPEWLASIGTPRVRTGSGRFHVYFAMPGVKIRNSAGKLGANIDVRADGGQVVYPGSIHPDTGALYRWVAGHSPDEFPLAPLPPEILAKLILNPPHLNGTAKPKRAVDVERRARAYLGAMPSAVSGAGGHDHTFIAAVALTHGFDLGAATSLQLLAEYNARCVPPWSDAELMHKVRSAIDTPHDKPRGWLRDKPRKVDAGEFAAAAVEHNAADGDDAPAKSRPLTDAGNAERFAQRVANTLRFCHSLGRWFCWDGTRWKHDDEGATLREAVLTARTIYAEAAKCGDDGLRAALATWAKSSESRGRIDAMLGLAIACTKLILRVGDLDADPWALNVQNGTIDLRSGRLRPHRREDNITRLAPIAFDPDAQCPLWMKFLRRTFAGDEDLIGFVQRWHGYSLTGDISEQYLPIYFGGGSNGKSVCLDTIAGVMGEYAGQAPPRLLTLGRSEEHPTELADLRGKRLLIASETERGARLKVQLVKKLTGDQVLKARLMRMDYFEFRRTCKIVLVTNHAPRISEDSEAIWRRIRQIPFAVTIPPAERDTGLLRKLESEWSGILAWMVRGCIDWQELGLGEPAGVVNATNSYRESEDSLGQFINERCTIVPAAFAPWKQLHETYLAWCDAAGERPLSGRDLADALGNHGFPSDTRWVGGTTAKGRVGIGMLDDRGGQS